MPSSSSSGSSWDRSQNWWPATWAAQNVSHARSKGSSPRRSVAASATRPGAPSRRRRRPSISLHGVAAEHLVDRLGLAEERARAVGGRRSARPTAQHDPVVELPAAHERAGRWSVGRAALVGVDGEGARPVGAEPLPDRRRGVEVAHVADPLVGGATTGTGRRARGRRAPRRCRACAGRRRRTSVAGASRSCQVPRASQRGEGRQPPVGEQAIEDRALAASNWRMASIRARLPARTGTACRPPAPALARAASSTAMTRDAVGGGAEVVGLDRGPEGRRRRPSSSAREGGHQPIGGAVTQDSRPDGGQQPAGAVRGERAAPLVAERR